MVACETCASIMKKCVLCRTNINEMVPLSVCSGGSGTISKISVAPTSTENERKEELQGINNAGHGVAMNNATPSNEPSTSAAAAAVAAAASINSTGLPSTTTNNLNLVNDVQRLQQQLQDIKEQVRFAFSFTYSIIHLQINNFRQCAQFALIESGIWSSFVDMEHVKCVAIKLKDVQFVVKKLKNVF